MIDNFLDLVQTHTLVLPVFALTLVIASGVVALLWRPRDEQDLALEESESERSRRQGARLARFASTGRLTPPWMPQGNHASMDSSPRVINTPYADMAERYGFDTYKHHSRGELILFDNRFDTLDVKKRVMTFRIERVVGLDEKTLKRFMASLRNNINRKAQRAGLLAKRDRRGNPGKVIGGDTK